MKRDSTNLAKNTIVVGIVMAMVMTVFVGIASATHEVWSDDIRITTDPEASNNPVIVTDSNNNSHIRWEANRDGSSEIFYTKLAYNGNTRIDDMRITNFSGDSKLPKIAIDIDNNVHRIWEDNREGNTEIYYTKLDKNGDPLINVTGLTVDHVTSDDPAIAIDSNNNVHITWVDNRDGNREIYYKHTISNMQK